MHLLKISYMKKIKKKKNKDKDIHITFLTVVQKIFFINKFAQKWYFIMHN